MKRGLFASSTFSLVWEQVGHAMDEHEQSSIPVEDTAVAATARSLVVAAVAAETPAYADIFGEPIPVEDCVDKVRRSCVADHAARCIPIVTER